MPTLKDFQDIGGFGDLGDFIDPNSMSNFAPLITGDVGSGGFDSNGNPVAGADNPLPDMSGLDPSSIASGGSSLLSSLARALTGRNNGGDTMSALSSLLPFIASIFGGINASHATNQATQQIMNSLNNANGQITSLLGGARDNFTPYRQAGTSALTQLQNLPQSNLAGMFRPIGSGRGLSLSQIVKG